MNKHMRRNDLREQVKAALTDRADDLFRHFIGEPTRAGGRDWRTKGRSSFSMQMRGHKRGLWHDHSGGGGGDLFDFVAREMCGLEKASQDFPRVLATAADWAGIEHGGDYDHAAAQARKAERDRKAAAEEAKARADRKNLVDAIAPRSTPAKDTAAETYLASRGLKAWPEGAIAFLPPCPDLPLSGAGKAALVIWAKDNAGRIKGGQRILLESDGSKAQLQQDQPRKPVFAASGGLPARFPSQIENGSLCVAEGPESALSVWQSTGLETWAVFGVNGFKAAPIPEGRKVILCPDQDAPIGTYPAGSLDAKRKEAAARQFRDAVATHLEAGKDIWIARAPEKKGSKRDLNDTLQRAGEQAVRDAIEAAQKAEPTPTGESLAPVWPAPEGDRTETLKEIPATIRRWGKGSAKAARAMNRVATLYAELDETLTPQDRSKAQRQIRKAVQAEMGLDYLPTATWRAGDTSLRAMVTGAQGVGKTAAFVGGIRDGNPQRGVLHDGAGLITVMFLPTHQEAAQAMGNYLAAYRAGVDPIPVQALGRTAQHPTDQNRTACDLSEQTAQAAKQGVNIQKAFCNECPFASGCAYLRRIGEIKEATASEQGAVVFGVHEHAFVKMAGIDQADRYIFDERVRSFAHETHSIAVDDWPRDLQSFLDRQVSQPAQTADALADLLSLIQPVRNVIGRAIIEAPERALEAIVEGLSPMLEEDQTPAQIVAKAAGALHQFNTDRLSDKIRGEIEAFRFGSLSGGRNTSLERRIDKQLEAAEEKHVRNLIEIMRAVAKELEQDHGAELRAVRVRTHRKALRIVAEVIEPASIPSNAPLLHLDGTGDHNLAKAWFGDMIHHHKPVERLTDRATFVTGHTFSTTSMTGLNPVTGVAIHADRAEVMRHKIRAVVERNAGAFVCTTKPALEALGDFPQHVVGWFGAIRGSNRAETCEMAILIGRNLPPPAVIEAKARAFAVALDRPFTPLPMDNTPQGNRWPTRLEGLRIAGGKTAPIEVEYHYDPTAQALVRQIRDAEAAQALDRVRAQYNTRRFLVMGACIPDMTFTETQTWKAVSDGGTKVQRAIEHVRVLPLSDSEAHAIAPQIWPNRKAAQRDVEYQQVKGEFGGDVWLGQSVIKNYLLPNVPTKKAACLVAYRRPVKGRGGNTLQHRALVFSTADQARATLEEVTGHLADFKIVDWSPEAERVDAEQQAAAMREGPIDTAATYPAYRKSRESDFAKQYARPREGTPDNICPWPRQIGGSTQTAPHSLGKASGALARAGPT